MGRREVFKLHREFHVVKNVVDVEGYHLKGKDKFIDLVNAKTFEALSSTYHHNYDAKPNRGFVIRNFASYYKKCKEDILKAIPDVWEYQNVISDEEKENNLKVFTTWELSFNQISGHQKEVQQKEHFLSLAAFFDITVISDRYFEAYFNTKKPELMAILSSKGRWDIDKLGGILAEFDKLSLIQMQEHTMNQQLFSIHPVIRAWIQIRMSRETRQKFAQESITALTSYLERIHSDDLSLETKQETLLHVDSCVRHDKDLLSGSSHWGLDDYSYAAECFAHLYLDQGRYKEAGKLLERAVSDNEKKLGATHTDTFWTRGTLAEAYAKHGRLDEAEKIYDQLLIDQKKTPGDMHPDTLKMVQSLANLYFVQHRYKEAEQLYKKLLADREEKLGFTDLGTLLTVGNLANVYANQGQYKEAGKLYKRGLAGCEEKLGAMHPRTLDILHNLGNEYHKQRHYDDAEKLYERALTGCKERLGVTHPDTLFTAKWLAELYRDQGRYNEAEKLLQEFDLTLSEEQSKKERSGRI